MSELLKHLVWVKARPAYFIGDPSEYRVDDFGNLMKFSEYGNRNSPLGWEIDHNKPKYKGGSDLFNNLRPLNWRANVLRYHYGV